MPLPDRVQQHLMTKGIDMSNIKTGTHIPKTVPGITIQHDHAAMVHAIRGGISAAKKARTTMIFKAHEPGAKHDVPSFMKKK